MKILFVAIIIGLLLIILGVLVYKNSCDCKSSPPKTPLTSPIARCLYTCDLQHEQCYRDCDPKDDICVRNCYQIKTDCYMTCLNYPKDCNCPEQV